MTLVVIISIAIIIIICVCIYIICELVLNLSNKHAFNKACIVKTHITMTRFESRERRR